jgi:hypothetical protein
MSRNRRKPLKTNHGGHFYSIQNGTPWKAPWMALNAEKRGRNPTRRKSEAQL